VLSDTKATDLAGEDCCELVFLETSAAAEYSGLSHSTGKRNSRTTITAGGRAGRRTDGRLAPRSERTGNILFG